MRGICEKHFHKRFIKYGERKTLIWGQEDPLPTIFSVEKDLPPSLLPTTPTTRKPPTDRSEPDQLNDFQKSDLLKSLSDITDSVCPTGYKLEVHDGKAAIFYKLDPTVNDRKSLKRLLLTRTCMRSCTRSPCQFLYLSGFGREVIAE